jgi:hypothetical protein
MLRTDFRKMRTFSARLAYPRPHFAKFKRLGGELIRTRGTWLLRTLPTPSR